MIWGGISLQPHTELVVIAGRSLIAEILEPHVVPFVSYVWPTRSPDLYPIEHLWDHKGRQIRVLQPLPNPLNKLKEKIREITHVVEILHVGVNKLNLKNVVIFKYFSNFNIFFLFQ